MIAEREVSELIDRDTIPIVSRRLFTAVRLCVYGARVRFYDLTLNFASGRSQSVPIRQYIEAGQCTRAFPISGGRRSLTSMRLTYEQASLGLRKATARLFGQ